MNNHHIAACPNCGSRKVTEKGILSQKDEDMRLCLKCGFKGFSFPEIGAEHSIMNEGRNRHYFHVLSEGYKHKARKRALNDIIKYLVVLIIVILTVLSLSYMFK